MAAGGGGCRRHRLGAGVSVLLLLLAALRAGARQADSIKRVKRLWQAPTPQAKENEAGPYPIYVTTYVSDKTQYYPLTYTLSGPGADMEPNGLFTIDNDGRVWLNSPLDREVISRYTMKVHAFDRTLTEVENAADLVVDVEDVNDNAPAFVTSSLCGSVEEMSPSGTYIMRLNATDADDPNTLNAMVVYSIVSQPPGNPFLVSAQTGAVTTQLANLDRELQETLILVVKASDLQGRAGGLSTTATATVSLTDINDNWPIFDLTSVEGNVEENKRDVTVAGLSVKDRDKQGTPNWRTVYRIVSGDDQGQFTVHTVPDSNGGAITVVKPLDFETKDHYVLLIAAANEVPFKGSSTEMERTATVEINVRNIDEPPAFTPNPKDIVATEGNKPPTILQKVVARDPDVAQQGLPLRYKIATDPADWLSVDPTTGMLTAKQSMDRESPFVKNGTYTVTVLAIQDGSPPATGTSTVNINLVDVNDNAPIAAAPQGAHLCLPEGPASPAVPVVLRASDADADPNARPFTFQLLNEPPGTTDRWDLHRNGSDTAFLTLKTAMLPLGIHNVTVLVRDQQGLGQTSNIQVRVCRCTDLLQVPTCSSDRPGGVGLGWDALAAILFSIFAMLMFGLLCCLFCRSKKPRLLFPDTYDKNAGVSSLVKYNEEGGKEYDKVLPLFTETTVSSGRLELMDDGSVNGENGHTNSWTNNDWVETTTTTTITKKEETRN